jgi:hypothetical protein
MGPCYARPGTATIGFFANLQHPAFLCLFIGALTY